MKDFLDSAKGIAVISVLTLIGFAGYMGDHAAAEQSPTPQAARGGRGAATARVAASAAPVTFPCPIGAPAVSSAVPNDAALTSQTVFNCFAWQEFIGLNWAAAPGQRGVADPNATAAQFGAPNATAPKVWETYKADSEVFLPGAAVPAAWNSPAPAPACSGNAAALARRPGTRVLSMSSAFGEFSLDETNQASGQWLADQNSNLVYYEIKMNQDEFNTIVGNQFYNATVQHQVASTGTPAVPGGLYQVVLPAGCLPGTCANGGNPIAGAIELKAAWRILTNSNQYGRYLTSQAVLVNNGACSTATMGLVGLHIIHKTVTQPQFVWATFEQVDNVPPASPATFNNSACSCQTAIPATCFTTPPGPLFQNCLSGQTSGQNCTANTPPPYNSISAGCGTYPTQVTRKRPLSNSSTDPIVATNTAAAQLIVNSNPTSVFQYYQLVDVLWSTSPPPDLYSNNPGTPGPIQPLSMSGATPDPNALPVANTTMETYVQTLTCLTCHVTAHTSTGQYATDFSFLLGQAYSPSSQLRSAAPQRPRRSLPKGLVKLRH